MVVRDDHSNKVTFDMGHEGWEEDIHMDLWGKSIPGRRKSKCT